MRPLKFPQANIALKAPEGMTEDECGTLHAHRDGTYHKSLWAASPRERLRFLLTGRIWLWVMSAHSQPPVALDMNSPFETPEPLWSIAANKVPAIRNWRMKRAIRAGVSQWVQQTFGDKTP